MNKVINVDELDERAVAYSKLTDEEAKAQVQQVKDRIKEIQSTAELSNNPQLVWELRELTSSLAWYRMNKLRSKFFKVFTLGASMRKAKRHPNAESLKRRGTNRQVRKKV